MAASNPLAAALDRVIDPTSGKGLIAARRASVPRQNGGTVGPWRAAEMVDASIQRVREGGKAETLITEVEGIKLNGPNDLVFAPDGSLVFSDPGTYNPKNPDPSYIHRLLHDGTAVFQNSHVPGASFVANGSGTTQKFRDPLGTLANGLQKLQLKAPTLRFV